MKVINLRTAGEIKTVCVRFDYKTYEISVSKGFDGNHPDVAIFDSTGAMIEYQDYDDSVNGVIRAMEHIDSLK